MHIDQTKKGAERGVSRTRFVSWVIKFAMYWSESDAIQRHGKIAVVVMPFQQT